MCYNYIKVQSWKLPGASQWIVTHRHLISMQYKIEKGALDLESDRPGFQFWFCHLLVVWPNLSKAQGPSRKMGITGWLIHKSLLYSPFLSVCLYYYTINQKKKCNCYKTHLHRLLWGSTDDATWKCSLSWKVLHTWYSQCLRQCPVHEKWLAIVGSNKRQ